MKKKIYPSIIEADLCNLQTAIEQIEPHSDGLHVDVMDNHFVPNLTFGPEIVNGIARCAEKPLWVHLMVTKPINWDDILMLPTGSTMSFHYESDIEISRFIRQLHGKKYEASLAINPSTKVEDIFPILNAVDHVLVMSVEPGFSGQSFLKDSLNKVEKLAGFRDTSDLNFRIGIDGGINKENIKDCAYYGVDDFAVAAAVFRQPDPIAAIKELKELIT